MSKQSNLHKELAFYKENQKDLVKKHLDKFIVIKNQAVVGVYDTEIEAYKEAQKDFELGTFLIQSVKSGADSYSHTFCSRVSV